MFIFEEECNPGCTCNRSGLTENFDNGDAAVSSQVTLSPERKNTHVRRFEPICKLNTAIKERPLIAKRSLGCIMSGPSCIRCPNGI